MKKIFLVLLALVLALSLGIVGCTAPAEQEEEEEEPEEIVLRYGHFATEGHWLAERTLNWENKITEETNGVVQWENYFGTLVSPSDTYSEIIEGVVDIGFFSPPYEQSGFEIQKAWTPFFLGADTADIQLAVANDLAEMFPEIAAEFSEVKILSNGSTSAIYHLLTKQPVYSLADFAGLQLRCRPHDIPVIEALGATAVTMSMFDVYPSLETGVLDGLIGPTEVLKSMNMADLITCQVTLNLPAGAHWSDGMNWDSWNSLPPDIQQVFEDNFEVWSEENDKWLWQAGEEGIAFAEQLGNTFIELPPEELAKLYELMDSNFRAIMAVLDAKGYNATAIYEEIRRLVEE